MNIANEDWRLEFEIEFPAFHFGGAQLTHSENVGYFGVNDQIASIRKNGEVLRLWRDFPSFLTEELVRVEALSRSDPVAAMKWSNV